jgi:hypothetical protein
METLDINSLKGNPKNPRRINKHDYEHLKQSIKRFGNLSDVVRNIRTDQLVGGHQRTNGFKELGGTVHITERYEQPNSVGTVAIGHIQIGDERFGYREVDWSPEWETAANIAANRIQGEFDQDLLAELDYELSQLENGAELLDLTGQREDEIAKLLGSVSGDGEEVEPGGNLADNFIVPPFSVLDTRQGYWQDRKRNWTSIGIKSELGRAGEDGKGSIGGNGASLGAGLQARRGADGKLEYTPILSRQGDEEVSGTSIFDPVLCEISYRWFGNPGGVVLDPFAGGSVRGIIAGKVGMEYIGLELRGEQVAANRVQGTELMRDGEPMPAWVEGDSNKTLDTITDPVDLIFSCPPYADLEVYSDDPDDPSNMPYPQFLSMYRSIITKACSKLKDDSFAVWVIGEVRGKDGTYYNFVGDTIQAFKDAGVSYYNEMILINSIGSLPMRAARAFNASRKIGKGHQNVLVFYKGNPQNIKLKFHELDFSSLKDESAAAPAPADPAAPVLDQAPGTQPGEQLQGEPVPTLS